MKSWTISTTLAFSISIFLSACIPSTLTPTNTPTNTPTLTPTPTPTFTPTPTSTPTETPTPTPLYIVSTESLGWITHFDASKGNNSINNVSLIPGRTGSAVEISYDVGNTGYVVITKGIAPQILAGTVGISFFYKGSGAPNTIEFKLMLKYPNDTADTTYGVLWNRATNTGDNWTQIEVLYSDFTCWWPYELCRKHGNKLDPMTVDRMDFVVSNKPGDEAGSGRVALDDVWGIRP